MPAETTHPKNHELLTTDDLKVHIRDMVIPIVPNYQLKEGYDQLPDGSTIAGYWVRFKSLDFWNSPLHPLELDHFCTEETALKAKCDAVAESGYIRIGQGELQFDCCGGRQYAHHHTFCIHIAEMKSFFPWSPGVAMPRKVIVELSLPDGPQDRLPDVIQLGHLESAEILPLVRAIMEGQPESHPRS